METPVQASKSQLLPSPNRTCVSGQLLTSPAQLWKGEKCVDPSPFSTDLTAVCVGGGGEDGWKGHSFILRLSQEVRDTTW